MIGAIGNGIAKVADVVAGVVETVAGDAAQATSDIVETLGTSLSRLIDLGRPVPVLGFVLHWLASVVSAMFALAATSIQAMIDVVVGATAGLIRIVIGGIGGLLALNGTVPKRGLGDIVSGIAGGILLVGGKTLALAQAVLFMQLGDRPLTAAERSMLHQVFRGSVALYNVRLVEGFAGLFSLNPRPFTLGNTVYMKGYTPSTNLETVVHECTHVWQFQNAGVRYASDALWAQFTIPGQDEYVWENEPTRGNSRWLDFNREAQAALVEDVWQHGATTSATGTGAAYVTHPAPADLSFFKGGVDHTPLAVQCANTLRNATAIRLSTLFN